MAEDSFDDSLCNYNLSNPKAVFNLACNYKYRIQQVKFKFKTPTKKQDVFYLLSKKVFRGHGKFSANENLYISTVLAKSFFLGFFIPVLHLSNNMLSVNRERHGGNETRCSEDS